MNEHSLEIQDLHFNYPDGTPALRGISCRFAQGEAVGIVGANGTGKSTFLQHLNGGLTPASGEIRFDGRTVTHERLPEVRRAVGMVLQNPDDQLFMPTVFDDVAFAPLNFGLSQEEAEAAAQHALEQVGMTHLRDRPPYKLSGGEKRAVAIATALAADPSVLIMDEPTAGLDPRGRRRLLELLRGFHHTRIIATHDLELVVQLCSRTIVLDSGRIVAEGAPSEVFSDEEKMIRHGLDRPHILRHLQEEHIHGH